LAFGVGKERHEVASKSAEFGGELVFESLSYFLLDGVKLSDVGVVLICVVEDLLLLSIGFLDLTLDPQLEFLEFFSFDSTLKKQS